MATLLFISNVFVTVRRAPMMWRASGVRVGEGVKPDASRDKLSVGRHSGQGITVQTLVPTQARLSVA
ncbi:MAG TPA: hypothetical protein VK208_21010 [Pyrinomonadaceae bacterium]|nr:hypothetical protein [Pyrinomonadaceae bacterium]